MAQIVDDELVTDGDDIIECSPTKASESARRSLKPRHQFSPEYDLQQKKAKKKPVFFSKYHPHQSSFKSHEVKKDVQSQAELARQVRSLPSKNFRLPETIYSGLKKHSSSSSFDCFYGSFDVNFNDYEARESFICTDDTIDDDDIYEVNGIGPDMPVYRHYDEYEDIIIKQETDDLKSELDESTPCIENFSKIKTHHAFNEKSCIKVNSHGVNSSKNKLGIKKPEKKMTAKSSAESGLKTSNSKTFSRLNLQRLLKRKSSISTTNVVEKGPLSRELSTELSSTVNNELVLESREIKDNEAESSIKGNEPSFSGLVDIERSQETNLSYDVGALQTPTEAAEKSNTKSKDNEVSMFPLNSKRVHKPKVFSDEFLYTTPGKSIPLNVVKKPLVSVEKKLSTQSTSKKSSVLSTPNSSLQMLVHQKKKSVVLTPKAKMTKKVLNGPSVSPFMLDSSGMLKSTADLLRSLDMSSFNASANFATMAQSISTEQLTNQVSVPSSSNFPNMIGGESTTLQSIHTKRLSRLRKINKRKASPPSDIKQPVTKKKILKTKPKFSVESLKYRKKFTSSKPSVAQEAQHSERRRKVPLPVFSDLLRSSDILESSSLDYSLKYSVYSCFASTPSKILENVYRRKRLNEFAKGLDVIEPKQFDFFYREILTKSTKRVSHADSESDALVDPIGGDFDLDEEDECLILNSANTCAQEIADTLREQNLRYGTIFEDNDDDVDVAEKLMQMMDELSSVEVRHYSKLSFEFILKQRLINLTTLEIPGGASLFYNLCVKNAHKFNSSLKIYDKIKMKQFGDAHKWLLKSLPVDLLGSWLTLLRFLKLTSLHICQSLIEYCDDFHFSDSNQFFKGFLQPKVVDPPLLSTNKLLESEIVANMSLVLVYPNVTANFMRQRKSKCAYESLFRNMLPRIACCVEKVELKLDVDPSSTVEECTWKAVRIIRTTVNEMVSRRPNDHIFVAGWGVSCLLNHVAICKISGVSGLLDFAFPTESPLGSRGDVEDNLCLTYCPVLFIVGKNAQNLRMDALSMLRTNTIVDTGIIVIGDANHKLQVSPLRLALERVTQKCVELTIVKHVIQFIRQVMSELGPAKNCRNILKPLELPNIFDVEASSVKGISVDKIRKQKNNNAAGKAASKQQSSNWDPRAIAAHPLMPAARSTLFASLKKAGEPSSISDIKIPAPSVLNKQVSPLLPTGKVKLPDTTNEEEEAAAALEI